MSGHTPHPEALDSFERACIPEAKMHYALRHPDKGRVFAALGFSEEAAYWEVLREAVRQGLPYQPATYLKQNEHGLYYEVVLPIRSPTNKQATRENRLDLQERGGLSPARHPLHNRQRVDALGAGEGGRERRRGLNDSLSDHAADTSPSSGGEWAGTEMVCRSCGASLPSRISSLSTRKSRSRRTS